MKKLSMAMLAWAALLCLGLAALAEQPTALDAFNALLAGNEAALTPNRTSADWLDDVLAGKYAERPADADAAAAFAADLGGLCAITNGDIAAYASHGCFLNCL